MRFGVCLLFGALLSLFTGLSPLGAAESPIIPMRITIVSPASDALRVGHAGDELARYLELMTHAAIDQVNADTFDPADFDADYLIELQLGEAAAKLRNLPGGENAELTGDGFLIEATGTNRLRIAALEPQGLLYGVYDYLEQDCGVGFFWDGEYIPQRSDLPVEGIDRAEIPRWPRRHFNFPGSIGLDKFHPKLRTMDHHKRLFDWMSRRKLNWSGYYAGPMIVYGGQAAKQVFSLNDTRAERQLFGGWPGSWIFPAQLQTEILQQIFNYSRARGIQWIYYFPFGNLPPEMRDRHPEYPYIPGLGYDATTLQPDTPEAWDWSKKYLTAFIELYGTDHVYMDSPYTESMGAASLEDSFKLKLKGAERVLELFKDVDPEAIWHSDTWDLSAQQMLWTPERIETYYTTLPQQNMLVYDLVDFNLEPRPRAYERTNYFYETPWTLAFLHSFQGDDQLHGMLERVIEDVHDVASDPENKSMEGIYNVPETIGHNVLYFELTSELAWQPEGVTLESYLDNFARRRWGAEKDSSLRRALDQIVAALHSDFVPYMHTHFYRKHGKVQVIPTFALFPNRRSQPTMAHGEIEQQRLDLLAGAIEQALSVRREQVENPLYANDLVEWTKEYLGWMSDWASFNAYLCFKEGDIEGLNQSAEIALLCLGQIEKILSTRPDYSLQRQIDNVMATPGINPDTPWLIKQHCVNWLYSTNDNYEQMHWFYRPRMKVYFDALRERAEAGLDTIEWEDIAEATDRYLERWLNEDIAVPEEEQYPGTSLEAIVEAFNTVHPHHDWANAVVDKYLEGFRLPSEDAIVIENFGDHIERTFDWYRVTNGSAWNHLLRWTFQGEGDQWFRYHLNDIEPGRYTVYTWVSDNPNNDHATNAPYTIHGPDGEETVKVDLTVDLRTWHKLGTFELDSDSYIELTDDADANLVVDSLCLVPMN